MGCCMRYLPIFYLNPLLTYLISTFDIAIPEKIAAIAKPKIINIGTIAVIKINNPAKVTTIVKILTNSPLMHPSLFLML